MQITYYLIAILIAAISVSLIIFGNKKLALLGDEKTLAFDGAKLSFFTNKEKLAKLFAYALMLVFGVRCLSGTYLLANTIGLNLYSPFGRDGQLQVIISLFAIWLMYPATILLITYPFFKDKIKVLTGLVKFFATPAYLFSLATISVTYKAILGPNAFDSFSAQTLIYTLEIGLGLAGCIGVWFTNYKTTFDKTSLINGLIIAVLMTMSAMPTFAPQVLFGKGNTLLEIVDLSPEHRIVLYGGIFTIIFGVLFNSLFGFGVLPFTLLPSPVTGTIDDIMTILLLCLLLGVIQIAAGYFMKALNCYFIVFFNIRNSTLYLLC
jgi:hypothetical protein